MNSEHFHTDIVIPGRPLALEPQARLGGVGLVRTNQVQHDFLEQREVLRRAPPEQSKKPTSKAKG